MHALQISTYFTEKLLGIVREILHMKVLNGSQKSDQQSEHRVHQFSSNVKQGDAALEFIKHVCAVLALDQNVQHDVLVIT